jgi:hypothetical protein
MKPESNTTTPIRELDCRESYGLEVRLLWSARDGRLWVSVDDAKGGDFFVVPVRDGERAADVFQHPFAYAASYGTGIRYAVPTAC